MPDRRQVLRALLLSAAGLALPEACGVPSHGGAIVDGWGPSSGLGNTENRTAPGPGDATDAADLVLKFLCAISGKLDAEARKKAFQQAQSFLTDRARAAWQPDNQQITVVRTTTPTLGVGGPAGSYVVSLSIQEVGQLTERGEVQAPQQGVNTAWIPMQFSVTPNADPSSNAKLLIDQLPPRLYPTLLLDQRALDPSGPTYYYQPQLIYFWDTVRHELVPDLRYLPLVGMSQTAQLTQLVNWLLAGPSDWLKPAVTSALPSGTTLFLPYVVTDKDGRLQINFSAGLQNPDLGLVMAQLRWTLSGLWTNPVQLQIASQPQRVDGSSDNYLDFNLASRSNRSAAEQFCVVDHVVRPVENPGSLPPVLNDPNVNKGVTAAALSRDKNTAALVHTNSMVIGKAGKSASDPPTYASVPLSGKAWSRPVFLPDRASDPARVLVAVDGQLYLVNADRSVTTITPSWANGVSAFAVSPDGHRIALLDAGRAAWVAPLLDDGESVSVASPRAIQIDDLDTHGIAWTRVDRVLVSAREGSGGWKLWEISVDGVLQSAWTTIFTNEIDTVVAYPPPPTRTSGSGSAMVELKDGQSENVYTNSSAPLQLTGTPLPSPSAGTSAGQSQPRAPFFLD